MSCLVARSPKVTLPDAGPRECVYASASAAVACSSSASNTSRRLAMTGCFVAPLRKPCSRMAFPLRDVQAKDVQLLTAEEDLAHDEPRRSRIDAGAPDYRHLRSI